MGCAGDELDILGIGNAIVDVISHEDDAFLRDHDLRKGGMTLIDSERADDLYAGMRPGVEMSGGSCANTMACAASFGSSVGYIGKVGADPFGDTFTQDIRAAGVLYETSPATGGQRTARSLVMVSRDGQRTMSTYLGACAELDAYDIDDGLVARSKVLFLEGYLCDAPRARNAFQTAVSAAKNAGRQVALTLSDALCVERHRDEFLALVDGGVDIVLANEDETRALFRTDTLEEAFAHLRGDVVVAVTRSEKGSVVSADGTAYEVPAEPVDDVVDTTGAGDAYAAGFLHGIAQRLDLTECARLGSLAAAEIISHLGSRPQVSLGDLR